MTEQMPESHESSDSFQQSRPFSGLMRSLAGVSNYLERTAANSIPVISRQLYDELIYTFDSVWRKPTGLPITHKLYRGEVTVQEVCDMEIDERLFLTHLFKNKYPDTDNAIVLRLGRSCINLMMVENSSETKSYQDVQAISKDAEARKAFREVRNALYSAMDPDSVL